MFVAAAVRILGWADAISVSPDMDRYAMYASWTGLALVLLYSLGQWRQIVAWFGHRNARYGTLASVSVLVGLGILVAANYLATRQNKRWDLTENQQFTLSDQTVKLLQGLTAPVKFVVFDRNTNFERFRTRLTNYEYNSRQVSTEYIDPDQRPVQAKEYEIQQYGTVVVEYMGRRERVTTDAEQDITNALIKVLNPSKKKVYFLGGHGEKSTADSERTGYSQIADALKRDNYEFDKLVLAQTNEIPADATVLVSAGPRTDLLEQEVPLLRDYLNKSGKLLVLLDPPEALKEFPPMPRLEGAAGRVGHAGAEVGGGGRERAHVGGNRAGGGAALPRPRDHRPVRSRDDVPAGPRHRARVAAAGGPVAATVPADAPAELVRDHDDAAGEPRHAGA